MSFHLSITIMEPKMHQVFAALVLTATLLVAQPLLASEHYICVTNDDVTSTGAASVQARFCERNADGCGSWQKQSVEQGETFLFQSFGQSTRIVEVEARSGGVSADSPASATTTRRPIYYTEDDLLTQAVENKAGMCRRGGLRFCGAKFVGSNGRC